MKYFGKGVGIIICLLVCTRFGMKYHKGCTIDGLEPFLDEKLKENNGKPLKLFYT